ncbi:hypothetical protein BGZ49_001691 [Haplosporangium sp. Z 27]|nr:hypothetical protein BGZ49_001691 [Haplosporangium sp. Z 27]
MATNIQPSGRDTPSGLTQHRTRNVLRSVIQPMLGVESSNPIETKRQSATARLAQQAEETLASSSNAKNMSSSALAQNNSTVLYGNRHFPGQIDSSGQKIVESLDDPGDITAIKFQHMILDDDTDPMEDSENNENRRNDNGIQNSLFITITVKPKGKTREQQYFCVITLDRNTNYVERVNSGSVSIDIKTPPWTCKSYELRRIVNSSIEVMYNHAQGQAEKKARPIELHYTFPEGVNGLRTISVSLPADEVRQLLVSREEGSEAGFLDGVEAHCADTMKIDFGRLNLTRAGCSSWYIASEGKVKIFSAISERHSLGAFIKDIGDCVT